MGSFNSMLLVIKSGYLKVTIIDFFGQLEVHKFDFHITHSCIIN